MSETIYVILTAAIALLNLAFTAGGVYVVVRQTRKDLNGLGAKVGRIEAASNDRYLTTCLVLMLIVSNENKHRVAEMLQDSARGK